MDGNSGGAQPTSDIVAQSGTRFSLINGASLTGRIDPTDVIIIGPNSTWHDTGASVIDSLILLNGGNYSFTAPVGGSYKTLTINGKLEGDAGDWYLANLNDQPQRDMKSRHFSMAWPASNRDFHINRKEQKRCRCAFSIRDSLGVRHKRNDIELLILIPVGSIDKDAVSS